MVLADLPAEMPVLVPTGTNWAFVVEAGVEVVSIKGRHIALSASAGSGLGVELRGLFLKPYEGDGDRYP